MLNKSFRIMLVTVVKISRTADEIAAQKGSNERSIGD